MEGNSISETGLCPFHLLLQLIMWGAGNLQKQNEEELTQRCAAEPTNTTDSSITGNLSLDSTLILVVRGGGREKSEMPKATGQGAAS